MRAYFSNSFRSGKLVVLREILKVWRSEGRRVLLFAQTIQMLDILQLFLDQLSEEAEQLEEDAHEERHEERSGEERDDDLNQAKAAGDKKRRKYSYLRLDGRVPIASRHRIIETFQRRPVSDVAPYADVLLLPAASSSPRCVFGNEGQLCLRLFRIGRTSGLAGYLQLVTVRLSVSIHGYPMCIANWLRESFSSLCLSIDLYGVTAQYLGLRRAFVYLPRGFSSVALLACASACTRLPDLSVV